jgi:hypothetical protein
MVQILRASQTNHKANKSRDILVTGCGDQLGCETSRIPHFLDTQLIDGGEVVSLMSQPCFTLQEDSWYSFLLKDESIPRTTLGLEGLGKWGGGGDLIGESNP